jgi:hypothetical protein
MYDDPGTEMLGAAFIGVGAPGEEDEEDEEQKNEDSANSERSSDHEDDDDSYSRAASSSGDGNVTPIMKNDGNPTTKMSIPLNLSKYIKYTVDMDKKNKDKKRKRVPAEIDTDYQHVEGDFTTEYEYSEKSAVPESLTNLKSDSDSSRPNKRGNTKRAKTTSVFAEKTRAATMPPPPKPAAKKKKTVTAAAAQKLGGYTVTPGTVTRSGRTTRATRAAREAATYVGLTSTSEESEPAPAPVKRGRGRPKGS